MTPIEPDNTYPVTEPDWIEAARQAFLWRWYFDDCGRISQDVRGDGLRDRNVVIALDGVRLNGTTTSHRAA